MEREEGKVLYFSLLGEFSCGHTEEEKTANSALMEKTGRKTLSFLQYFIVNHGRNISSEELIGQFWADSSDPASLLRNMLFKTRNLLKVLYPEGNKLLVTLQSCYRWSTEIHIQIDAEQFEELCLKARGLPEEAYCGQLARAIELYKGDFLAGNDSEWARTLRQYYRTLYLDACRAVLPRLYKKEQWMELISVCSQAYGVDFGQEDFTAYHMQALIALGQPGQAVERYRIFRDRMLEEYEMPPTERIEQLYLLAEGLMKNNPEEKDILSLVCEMEEHSHAFFCTFGTFQSIVALERRHMERSGQPSSLMVISLNSGAVPTTDSRRLERILLEKLRTGDPIARLEAGSYVVMLTGADEENARLVFGRIDCAFHRTYRHSGAQLSFQVADLRRRRGDDGNGARQRTG